MATPDLAADRTVVECDWLYLPDVVVSGKDVSRSVELFHRVNQQDFDACERCQPAMASKVWRPNYGPRCSPPWASARCSSRTQPHRSSAD